MAADDLETLSVDELTEQNVATFANQLPEKNVGRNSDNWTRMRVLSGACADIHQEVKTSYRDAMPDTVAEKRIDRHLNVWGITRKGETAASGEDAGKIRGTNGSAWFTTDTLIHKSGLRFRPTVNGSIVAGGEALVGIVAIDVGPETRLEAGEVLEWEIPPAGLEAQVVLVADLSTGGEDQEAFGAVRTRMLDKIRLGARGGSASDWKAWVLESAPYIASAYVWPNRAGRGSVDVAGLKTGSGAARLLTLAERDALLAYVTSKRPVAAGVRVLEVITQAQNVAVVLEPKKVDGVAKDWSPEVQMTVSAWNAGTRQLTFGQDRPAGMGVGHRLVIDETSGVVFEIESLVSTNAVILKDAQGQTPASPQEVYPAGPLTALARDAILAHFDSLGPRLGAYGQGDWESSLLIGDLSDAALVDGVRDRTFVTPTANVEPTAESAYPDDTQVRLLVAGNVLVRYL